MKKKLLLFILLIACLAGCSGSKGYNADIISEKLINKGISEKSIKVTENPSCDRIFIYDSKIGHANIYVYKNAKDARKYWDNLDERYYNLEYLDEVTAVGYVRDVCDASIEEWIYYDRNVIVSVEQYVANEWAVYTADDGEEYYGDGTKVSDVPTYADQTDKAAVLQNMILDCLK